MNKIKYIIIILIIILLIICVATIILLGNYKNNNNDIFEEVDAGEIIDYAESNIEPVSDSMKFFTVNSCINTFFDIINKNNSSYFGYTESNEYGKIISDEEINQRIYNLLSNEYITKNNITQDNVREYVDNVEEKIMFVPLKMNILSKQNVDVYSVYGLVYNLYNQYMGDKYYIVTLDKSNSTFSIEPKNEVISDINEINLQNEDNVRIEKNSDNTYQYETANYEYILKKYLETYKKLALTKTDIVFNMLDEEYKNKKFTSLEDFKKYVENKKQEIQTINLQKYQVNNTDNFVQYVGLDQYDNYYIFRENNVMDFKLILDTYTIDLPEFLEKYEAANDAEKAGMNFQKVFSAINDGDYRYVYNKLDPTFRQNNFPTETDFENYIKQNFYTNNSVGYSNYKTSGDLHIYEVSITDKDNETNPTKTKNFIMQLKEGTDFVMSFNVE